MTEIRLMGINKTAGNLKVVHYEVNGHRYQVIVPIEADPNDSVKKDWERRRDAGINF